MATFYELLIKGDEKAVAAYVDGFMYARGIRKGWYVAGRIPFQLKHVRELIKYHGNVQHVLCAATHKTALVAAFRKASPDYEFELVEARKVRCARFKFSFETANRQIAGRIKRAVRRLPAGAKLEEYVPREVTDPSARGAEVYTPVHEYVFKGKGVVAGDIDAVVAAHARLSEVDMVRCADIEIVV